MATAKDTAYKDGERHIHVMVIGKTGHSKSTVGNALLKKNAFSVSHYPQSETTESKYGSTTRKNKTLVVVDSPGIFGTRNAASEAIDETTRIEIVRACSLVCPGFHALIFVFKAGERFTKENRETIEIYHKLFGDDFWNYTFIVITHWDLMEAKNIKFEDYLKEARENEDFKCMLYSSGDKCYPIGTKKTEKQAKAVINGIEENLQRFEGRYFRDVLFDALNDLQRLWNENKFNPIFDRIFAMTTRIAAAKSLNNKNTRGLGIIDAWQFLMSEREAQASDELQEDIHELRDEIRSKLRGEGAGCEFEYLVRTALELFASFFEGLYKKDKPSNA